MEKYILKIGDYYIKVGNLVDKDIKLIGIVGMTEDIYCCSKFDSLEEVTEHYKKCHRLGVFCKVMLAEFSHKIVDMPLVVDDTVYNYRDIYSKLCTPKYTMFKDNIMRLLDSSDDGVFENVDFKIIKLAEDRYYFEWK